MKLKIILLSLCSILVMPLMAQQDVNPNNLSNIKVDELSDIQVQGLIKRAEESGLTPQQFETAALARGMSASELQKLRQRIEQLQNKQSGTQQSSRLRDDQEYFTGADQYFDNLKYSFLDSIEWQKKQKNIIFGQHIFTQQNLTFEPSLNIPTPANYVLGPGDEVIIDVWGASQANYQLEINPDGYVFVDNLGPVYLAGKTVSAARSYTKNRFTQIYSGLTSSTPNTFMQLSIGKIKTIKVNIIGEVQHPGTYSLPSLASAFNALYVSGGPNQNGTLRSIELIRDGKKHALIDVYDYLLNGNTASNVQLHDNDILLVKPYINRVSIYGEVKRPMIYETLDNETLANIINYAGGFTEKAYKKHIKVERNTDTRKTFIEISNDTFSDSALHNGDKIYVESIIQQYENRVSVEGAVFRPGYFQLTEGMTVSEIVEKAGGIKEDAYLCYASIYRLNNHNQVSIVPVELRKIIETGENDIALEKNDILKIASIFDLEEDYTVKISGAIMAEGNYPYHRELTIQELIIMAGGLKESSSYARVEVARRIKDKDATAPRSEMAKVFLFNLNPNLSIQHNDTVFKLAPYDAVFIRTSPGYEEQRYVQVEGEVAFPGKYAILDKTERLSDIIDRAGGLTDEAYMPGARLIRKLSLDKERQKALEAIQAESIEDTINNKLLNEKEQAIGINLQHIMNNPHSKADLLLLEGDRITIPKQLQTVKVSGAALYPSTSVYRKGASARKYIAKAGGFGQNAKKTKVYVIYPNGSVDKTFSLFGLNDYPKILPGSEIVIPEKPERKGLSAQEAVSLGTAVSSMALIIVTIINNI